MPELSRVEELEDSYWFSYSVRMRLLDPAPGQTDALTTCQLSDRHWVIRANDTVVAEVRGRAVIGMVCGPLTHFFPFRVAKFMELSLKLCFYCP